MPDLNQATFLEIQMERDKSYRKLELINHSFQDGLLSVNEFLDQATPHLRSYEECKDRLVKDVAWANEVAQQLSEVW